MAKSNIVYQPIINGYPASITDSPSIALASLACMVEGVPVERHAANKDSLDKELSQLRAVGHAGSDSDLDYYLIMSGTCESFEVAMHDASAKLGSDSRVGSLVYDGMFIPGAVIQCALYDFAIEGADMDDLAGRIRSEFQAVIRTALSETQARGVVDGLREAGSGVLGEGIAARLFSYEGTSAAFLKRLPDVAAELFIDVANRAYPEDAATDAISI